MREVVPGFGLVIQGPLLSTGRDGGGAWVTYDCVPSILETASNYRHLFEQIVVSTWKSEDAGRIAQLRESGVEVLLLDDPLASITPKKPLDNRVRQFFSSQQGVRAIRPEIANVCKMRTDQAFDLDAFLRDFTQNMTDFQDSRTVGLAGFLQALMFNVARPYSLCDYAYVAPREVLGEFFDAQLSLQGLSFTEDNDWAEGDSIRKYLYSLRDRLPATSIDQYFPAIPKDLTYLHRPVPGLRTPLISVQLWQTALTAVVAVSRRAIFESLVWRGAVIQLEGTEAFRDEWLHSRISYVAALERATSANLVKTEVPRLWLLRDRQRELRGGGKTGAKVSRIIRGVFRRAQKLIAFAGFIIGGGHRGGSAHISGVQDGNRPKNLADAPSSRP